MLLHDDQSFVVPLTDYLWTYKVLSILRFSLLSNNNRFVGIRSFSIFHWACIVWLLLLDSFFENIYESLIYSTLKLELAFALKFSWPQQQHHSRVCWQEKQQKWWINIDNKFIWVEKCFPFDTIDKAYTIVYL